jgi:hypothetical protein
MKLKTIICLLTVAVLIAGFAVATPASVAYAADTTRAISDKNWTVNEAGDALALNTDDGAIGFFGYWHTYKGKNIEVPLSLTLSASEAVISYSYKFEGEGVPLPGSVSLALVDGAIIRAKISGSADKNGNFSVTAKFEKEIDFLDIQSLYLGTLTTNGKNFISLNIPVSASLFPVPRPIEDLENKKPTVAIKVELEKLFDFENK